MTSDEMIAGFVEQYVPEADRPKAVLTLHAMAEAAYAAGKAAGLVSLPVQAIQQRPTG